MGRTCADFHVANRQGRRPVCTLQASIACDLIALAGSVVDRLGLGD
jgi:hypothetical protein